MIYSIAYEAVKKKASTTPPNGLIANTEMAASIGLILKETDISLATDSFKEPETIKNAFLEVIGEKEAALSETSVILLDLIRKYKVKQMVNETMEDLICLVNGQM